MSFKHNIAMVTRAFAKDYKRVPVLTIRQGMGTISEMFQLRDHPKQTPTNGCMDIIN